MALHAATQTMEFFGQLADELTTRDLLVTEPAHFPGSAGSEDSISRLDALFRTHGSDKSVDHDYHLVYAAILDQLPAGSSVLEVGLGTNNEDIVSTMGRSARPGASLRAFRDYLPESRVYGADIDRDILFHEERIQTFWVDQTSDESVRALEARLPGDLHLIIDDGLHSPNANLQILMLALRVMPSGGWLVIEDIIPAAQDVWRLVTALLPENFEATLVRAKEGDLFIVRRTA
jgi:SAM-dependent methyltransferase